MDISRNLLKNKVQTVLGPIDPDALGYTLTHEHLLHDLPKSVFKKDIPPRIQHLNNSLFTLDVSGWIRQYPYSFDDNLEFSDHSVRTAVKKEMLFFKESGGGTIVDNSSIGLRSKDQHYFLKQLSHDTGVNIVLGAGYYVHGSQQPNDLLLPQEKMQMKIKDDMLVGVNGSEVKCGIIGEIGCSWPLLPFEKRSLFASAAVQEEIACPVNIHPARHKDSPLEIIRIFQEAGGNASKTVMSHLDRTFFSDEDFAEFADGTGCFCELDLFGVEVSHYQQNEGRDMPNDSRRIEILISLINHGFSDKLVISHDIHTKHRLMGFGGHGYSHIIVNLVSKMLQRGISQENIEKILIHNPKQWLTFA